jgi:superfamily II DNA or RNA helicase
LLATPKTSVTQAIGRILRDHPEKKEPVVLDFVDTRINVLGAYWGSRKKKYKALGYL